MEQISLEATKRTGAGKISARREREKGLIPAVVYGKKIGTMSLSIKTLALDKALSHGAAHKIVNLRIAGKDTSQEQLCMIHEVQKDTFGKRVLHVDFRQISMEEKITAMVPIQLKGTPAAAKEGGILDHVLWEVEVKALPMNLPERLEGDVSELLIHQSILVKNIPVPEGVEVLEDPEAVVAVVHPPRAEEVVVAAPTAEGAAPGTAAAAPTVPAQPEVIAKGKKEEEGAEEKAPEKPEKPEKGKK